jgi:hypothetical protein
LDAELDGVELDVAGTGAVAPIFGKLESMSAAAYVGACWVLCSEIERLAAEGVPEDGRRLMRATLEELGKAVDSVDFVPGSPVHLRLVDQWKQLSGGQIEDQATAHVYFAFEDVAGMLAGSCRVGRAHSWLLNPFVDLLQGPPADSGKGYVRVNKLSMEEGAPLVRYLDQVAELVSELGERADHADVRALTVLRAQVFKA